MKGRRLGDGTGETDNLQTNDTGQKKRPRGSLGSTRKTSAICFVPSDGISTHLFMYATKYPQTPSVFPKIDCNNNETELRITCNIQILKLQRHVNLTYNTLQTTPTAMPTCYQNAATFPLRFFREPCCTMHWFSLSANEIQKSSRRRFTQKQSPIPRKKIGFQLDFVCTRG